MAFKLDEGLRPYATDAQWAKLKAVEEHGSERKAAEILGIHKKAFSVTKATVLKKAAIHGYAPDFDMVHPVPDGYRVRGVSTLYDMQTGAAKVQWVKTREDSERQEAIIREMAEAMAETLPRVKPTAGPKQASADLMACYPVGDHHFGQLSWDKETGADYDLDIAERLLTVCSQHLIETAPSCKQATIALLGDLVHYDGFESVTPTNRNQLDSDTRFPKMVRVAIRSVRRMIESALRRHQTVRVIIEIGNHDLATSICLMECLANVYENEPRVTVDTSPMHFHYFDFGKCLVGMHHGHGVKMQALPLIMATDRPAEWGRTKYRYWWTGHIHHSKTQAATSAQDFSGCTVESFRVLCPPDAWAAQKGYRPIRDQKAIILHREFGEVARHTVSPAMFGAAA